MSRPPDDRFLDVDRQLKSIEAESRMKAASDASVSDVAPETARKFNDHAPSQSFAARHPRLTGLVGMAVIYLLAGSVYKMVTTPSPRAQARGPFHLVTGVIRDSSIVQSSRFHYGSVAAETVALPDGRVVTIRSDSGMLF